MLLATAERNRREVASRTDRKKKSALGQFMTPASVARFMASRFPPSAIGVCRLLDAGAGFGALTCAFLDRWKAGGFAFSRVETTAYEVDADVRAHLEATLAAYSEPRRLAARVIGEDFIMAAALDIIEGRAGRRFTHAILNPPYKKLNNDSPHRRALSQVGIETVNLYSAFIALAIEQMAPGGVVVAIIPRSFCNGTYYKPFRDLLLDKAALRAVHLFDSRDSAFRDDAVLQENIIVVLERGGSQGDVVVTTSTDDSFADTRTFTHPFDRIVFPGDRERFIHVPTTDRETALERVSGVRCTLDDIGVRVSTGPVVDFRLKDHLRLDAQPGAAPLLYPMHFSADRGVTWPVGSGKKANAIVVNDDTLQWLMPNAFYCVVRRFSSKEERRRIVANVVRPQDFPAGTEFLGLENHVNVFNDRRRGLPELMAFGLAAYMNTTAVDEAFRRFSGHTQVNAGDLRTMRYPPRDVLMKLGAWGKANPTATQEAIDRTFAALAA